MSKPVRYKADWAVQCAGKEKFETHSNASRVAKRQNKKRLALGVYRCPHCGMYHIGSEKSR